MSTYVTYTPLDHDTGRMPTLESGDTGLSAQRYSGANAFTKVYEILFGPHGKAFAKRNPDALEEKLAENRHPIDPRLRGFYRWLADRKRGGLLAENLALLAVHESRWHFEKRDTYSSCFENIHRDLEESSAGLSICAMTASNRHVWSAYPWLVQVWFTMRGQDARAANCVFSIMDYLLKTYWTHDDDEVAAYETFARRLRGEMVETKRYWRSALPSQEPSSPPHGFCSINGSLGCLNGDVALFTLQWLREPPQFRGDVHVYVSEPLLQRPDLDCARILVLKDAAGKVSRRHVILGTSSSRLLARIIDTQIKINRLPGDSASVPIELMWFLYTPFECMRSDLCYFMEKACQYVDEMTITGRNRPSGWKIKYVLHLQECLTMVAEQTRIAVETGQGLIQSMLPSAEQDVEVYSICTGLTRCLLDLEYLAAELEALAASLDALTLMLKEQMSLSQSFWNMVLTFLVALYVPLSFATSFFSMNIQNDDFISYWTNTTVATYALDAVNWTNETVKYTFDNTEQWMNNQSISGDKSVGSLSPVNGSQVFQLVTTGLPSTQSWTWGAFAITAVLLPFCTIVLPFLVGTVFRWTLRVIYRHRTWGLVVAAPVPLGVLIALEAIGFYSFDDNLDVVLPALTYALIAVIPVWHMLVSILLRDMALLVTWSVILTGLTAFGLAPLMVYIYTPLLIPPAESYILFPVVAMFLLLALWTFRPDLYVSWQEFRDRDHAKARARARMEQ